MALIHDIRSELLDEKKDVSPILRKLKVLAFKLEADILEDWVKHEVEGYPEDVPVPNYRKTSVTYKGDFMGIGSKYPDLTIPSAVIAKYATNEAIHHEIRDSLPVIDWQVKDKRQNFEISELRQLKLLFQGRDKIFIGMKLTEIMGIIDASAFIKIQQVVRDKILDLVLKIEKEMPSVVNIDIDGKSAKVSDVESETVSNIARQTIYGNVNVTNITTTGDGNVLQVGAIGSFVHALTEKGIDEKDAEELAKIAQEKPEILNKKGIANWVGEKIKQGAEWAQGMDKDVVTATIVEIAKKFLGL